MQQIQTNNFGLLNYDEIIDINDVRIILQQLLIGSKLKIYEVTISLSPSISVEYNDTVYKINITKSLCQTQ